MVHARLLLQAKRGYWIDSQRAARGHERRRTGDQDHEERDAHQRDEADGLDLGEHTRQQAAGRGVAPSAMCTPRSRVRCDTA